MQDIQTVAAISLVEGTLIKVLRRNAGRGRGWCEHDLRKHVERIKTVTRGDQAGRHRGERETAACVACARVRCREECKRGGGGGGRGRIGGREE